MSEKGLMNYVYLVSVYEKEIGTKSMAWHDKERAVNSGKAWSHSIAGIETITFEEKKIEGILYHAELSDGGYVRVEEIEIR